ncbi:MAG TPA: hypothetical protein VME20_10365 [Acidimicrobiales bacterium]|nr:hypothetical protein [Acidimicrobiales bacterium]
MRSYKVPALLVTLSSLAVLAVLPSQEVSAGVAPLRGRPAADSLAGRAPLGHLTTVRHGRTITLTMSFPAAVTSISVGFYFSNDTIAQVWVAASSGKVMAPDAHLSYFEGQAGYCSLLSGISYDLGCQRQADPVPAHQTIKGTIVFSHLRAPGSAWGVGAVVGGKSINTNEAQFS